VQIPADSLRRVLDSVFASPEYVWRSDDATLNTVARWWRDVISWITQLRATNPQAYRIFVALLVAALVGILLHALWVFLRTVRGAAEPRNVSAPASPELRRDAGWHLRTADDLAGAGRCREALQHLFLGTALRLEAAGRVTYRASRTPAELVADARVAPADRAHLRSQVRMLYGAVFGGAPCGMEEYRAWRALADRDWNAAAH
jgi:hypothetical protein